MCVHEWTTQTTFSTGVFAPRDLDRRLARVAKCRSLASALTSRGSTPSPAFGRDRVSFLSSFAFINDFTLSSIVIVRGDGNIAAAFPVVVAFVRFALLRARNVGQASPIRRELVPFPSSNVREKRAPKRNAMRLMNSCAKLEL